MDCADLLERWHRGDREALSRLLDGVLPKIHEHVRRRLGESLRRKVETGDCVQDAVVEFLRDGPRFVIRDEAQLCALLQRIAENVLRDRHDWFSARRRSLARERPLSKDTVLRLDPPVKKVETPSRAIDRNEREAWARMGLELLDPAERELIVLRLWDDLPFDEIGRRLGVTADAARMRFHRAVASLSEKVAALRLGGVAAALEVSDGKAGMR